MNKYLFKYVSLSFSLLFYLSASAQPESPVKKEGNPADHLPAYIKRVSGFGERPEWSHDGSRILFVSKPMGEVYELDLASGLVYPKTRHFNHYGFTRAVYLYNGDILLAGPREPFDPADPEERKIARDRCWLSVLDKAGNRRPTPLNVLCAEGPAVSRDKPLIAWTIRDRQNPDLGQNHARLYSASLDYSGGSPRLVDQKVIFDSHQLPFDLGGSSLETQNLVPPEDKKLVFSVYRIQNSNNTDTYMVDLETGEYQNLTRSPGYYDEPEGIFPDGKFTCVEHASSEDSAWPLIDLYKLKLDGSGEMQRLTYFTEYEGYKASQGVVSDDGNYLCFQMGKSGDEAGVGYGFFIMDLDQAQVNFGDFTSYAAGKNPFQEAADQYVEALKQQKPLPLLSEILPEVTLDQAYNVQRSWVAATWGEMGAGGVKGAMVTPGAQKTYGLKEPAAAILREDGKISGNDQVIIRKKDYPDLNIETEIGFVIGKRIDAPLNSIETFKQHVAGIVPVVELPAGKAKSAPGNPKVTDVVAGNVRSMGYIVGSTVTPVNFDPKEIRIKFTKDGRVLHEATGNDNWQGPWETAFFLTQFAHRQGIVLEPGQVIICGALGKIHTGEKGSYQYVSDLLGEIKFTVE